METETSSTKMSWPANAGHPGDAARASSILFEVSPGSPAVAGDDTEKILAVARSWIGTPYVHQASVKGAGCDCLGLLRGVFRELCGEEAETPPPYSPDWAEASGAETLYSAMLRHLNEIELSALAPGDIALFRMAPRSPAKHCGIVGEQDGRLTLIHARQNKQVSEERFSAFWQRKLAFAFRM